MPRPSPSGRAREGDGPGRPALGRLYLILGSAVILVLVAALVGPYVIDWNSFRPTFERRASEILGQPVRIVGDADLTLLPTPSLTFDRVEIGESEGRPMMTVDHVSMKLELLAFLSGRIAITEMTIERPVADITVDDAGGVDWLIRPGAGVTLDPSRVSIADVTVTDGAVSFFDARTNAAVRLTDINTDRIDAPSLDGPWRVEGNLVCRAAALCGDALPVTFSVTTGRVAADGSLGVAVTLVPADAAIAGTLRTDGTIGGADGPVAYRGAFRFDKLAVATAATPEAAETLRPAWTIGGRFELGAEGVALSEFLFDPGQGTITISGDASLTFGANTRFDADIATRQIDLDTLIGEGPANPMTVAAAGTDLIAQLRALAPPEIPGRIRIAVPAIIVAGSALQNLTVDITAVPAGAPPAAGGAPAPGEWQVAALSVDLPGASHLSVTGTITMGDAFGFAGLIRLASQQPATLGTWWRGADAAPTRLAPFELGFDGRIAENEIVADRVAVTIGTSTATGDFAWTRDPATDHRQLSVTVAAQEFDIDQLTALGQLLAGNDFATTDLVADEATIAFTADDLRRGDVRMTEVAVDVVIEPNLLTVNRFVIGDLAGARFEVTSGRLDLSGDTPRGTLEATLDAATLDGVVALARQIAPDAAITDWLTRSAPFLTPTRLSATVEATGAGGAAYRATMDGTAGDTTVRATLDLTGDLADWDAADVALAIDVDAPDTVELARQAGLAIAPVPAAGPASIRFTATGVPSAGMTASIGARPLAGLNLTSDGVLTMARDGALSFAGPASLTGDIGPIARMAGLALPGLAEGVPSVVEANVTVDASGVAIAFLSSRSSIAEQSVDGALTVARADDGYAVTGALTLESLDLGWLLTLPLGVDPLPGGPADIPWSRTPFPGSVLDGTTADLAITAARLVVGPSFVLDGAALDLTIGANGGAVELTSATLSGAAVRGGLTAQFIDGQAAVDGQLIMTAVPLSSVIWRSDGQPVAEGTFDLNLQFEALGRSPAGLIATMAGSGTLQISDGVFHFMSADAFRLILELAGQGEPLSEARLREAFTGFLDAGDLPFTTATADFQIAGGVVTANRVFVDGGGATSVARAQIDLNRLVVDSSWEFALRDDGDTTLGPEPSVFITFAGPIAEPLRRINVAPLAGYLSLRSIRDAERTEADLLERERFLRMIERINADRDAAAAAAAAPPPAAATPEPVPAPQVDPIAPLINLPPAALGPVPPAPIP